MNDSTGVFNYESEATSFSTEVTDGSRCSTPDNRPTNFMGNTALSEEEKERIIQYVDDLKYMERRDQALYELSKRREYFQDLAPFIWHSVGTIAAL